MAEVTCPDPNHEPPEGYTIHVCNTCQTRSIRLGTVASKGGSKPKHRAGNRGSAATFGPRELPQRPQRR